MLLYPFVGSGAFEAARTRAWNGSDLLLVPVRVLPADDPAANLARLSA
jgi:hypothetical protein